MRSFAAGIVIIAGLAVLFRAQTNPAGAPLMSSQAAVVKSEFIFETAPFASAHASTIVETNDGLAAAWFGGSAEGRPDVDIWISRHDGRTWSPPTAVADGLQVDGKTRYPCWNPVLYHPRGGPLLLFYKVGPSPSAWWGQWTSSSDDGRTWSKPHRIPDGYLGPVRNKPVELPDGSLLCGSSTENAGWRVHMERSPDLGMSWERTLPLNDPGVAGLIQPTILRWPSGRTQILCRSRQGRIFESWMGPDWTSWSPPRALDLPNPNSGIDAVVLTDGRGLLVYNHSASARYPLNIAVSNDGRSWRRILDLESGPGEYSYPAVIQTRDGLVHVVYTWKRLRIKHVVVDPVKLGRRD
jgi:predicted neuraminidase